MRHRIRSLFCFTQESDKCVYNRQPKQQSDQAQREECSVLHLDRGGLAAWFAGPNSHEPSSARSAGAFFKRCHTDPGGVVHSREEQQMPDRASRPTEAAELIPLIYEELRGLAAGYMRREGPGHTLQPTALVHEAYLRLVGKRDIHWESKSHFLAMAATEMRRILVEHARKRRAEKHGGAWQRVTLDESVAPSSERTLEVLALDQALSRLAEVSARQARVAVLRIFAGLTELELADLLEVSERTVREDWRFAKAWLARALAS